MMGSIFYGTDWISCGVQRDGTPCSNGSGYGYGYSRNPGDDCLKCCVDDISNIQSQLPLNTSPCVCPDGSTETICW